MTKTNLYFTLTTENATEWINENYIGIAIFLTVMFIAILFENVYRELKLFLKGKDIKKYKV